MLYCIPRKNYIEKNVDLIENLAQFPKSTKIP